MVETQPQLQPALLSLSAMISHYFTRRILPLLRSIPRRQILSAFNVYHALRPISGREEWQEFDWDGETGKQRIIESLD
jgi:hypothetical protein